MKRLLVQSSAILALLIGVDLVLRWSTWSAEIGGLWVTKGPLKVLAALAILATLEGLALTAFLATL